MSDRKTEGLQKNFQKTVSGGFKSLMGKKDQTFFMLEIKTPTDKFAAGKSFTFTGDYVEIGRSPKCALNFEADNRYISRLHAAIQRQGNKYLLKHLSKTNPTIVNGMPIIGETALKNGDEIQLSEKGPKLGFLAPQNNFASSLPLSVRLQAFGREVLKPYKVAVAVISAILLISLGASTYVLTSHQDTIKELGMELNTIEDKNEALRAELEATKSLNQQQIDDLLSDLDEQREEKAKMEAHFEDLKRRHNENLRRQRENKTPNIADRFDSDIYFITVEKIEAPGFQATTEEDKLFEFIIRKYNWFGTGFLLNDGRFVTARHVIEAWMYPREQVGFLMNKYIKIKKIPVVVHFKAYSPSGETLSFKNTDFLVDTSKDKLRYFSLQDETGAPKLTAVIDPNIDGEEYWGTDWAIAKTKKKGSISVNKNTNNLKKGERVYILGYSTGDDLNKKDALDPIYSESKIGQSGLNRGVIVLTNRGFEGGNSGGPAFIKVNNEWKAIGIVSHSLQSIGGLVPIAPNT